jgi:hypothetical protein
MGHLSVECAEKIPGHRGRPGRVAGVPRYGVKLKTGKVVWVQADEVEVREGVVLFRGQGERGPETVAGFSLGVVDHFGRPEAFPGGEAGAPDAGPRR